MNAVVPKPYLPEFRRRAVELARQGSKSTVELAKDLGISRSCLQNWVAQAAAEEKTAGEAVRPTSAKKKELAELRRRNGTPAHRDRTVEIARMAFRAVQLLPSPTTSTWSAPP